MLWNAHTHWSMFNFIWNEQPRNYDTKPAICQQPFIYQPKENCLYEIISKFFTQPIRIGSNLFVDIFCYYTKFTNKAIETWIETLKNEIFLITPRTIKIINLEWHSLFFLIFLGLMIFLLLLLFCVFFFYFINLLYIIYTFSKASRKFNRTIKTNNIWNAQNSPNMKFFYV